MTTLELCKQIEDEISPILEYRPLKLSILYKTLVAMGYTREGLDYRIDHMLRTEAGQIQTIKRC